MSLIRITRSENILFVALESNGFFLSEWVKSLREQNYEISDDAFALLERAVFNPCLAKTRHNLQILCGASLDDTSRTIDWLSTNRTLYGLTEPHPEVAFLLRTCLTREQMFEHGLDCLVTMHAPLQTIRGVPLPGLLDIQSRDRVDRLGAFTKPWDYVLNRTTGFVFDATPF